LKNIRKSAQRRKVNYSKKRRLKNAIKHIKRLDSKKSALKAYPEVQSLIDRAIQDGIINKNTASRYKSRLLKFISGKK